MKVSTSACTVLAILLLSACSSNPTPESTPPDSKPLAFGFPIQELSDEQYPDNPDIGFRSAHYNTNYFDSGRLESTGDDRFLMEFYASGDTIAFQELSLAEYIPTVPQHVREDEYLTYISLVNQEWNRNQVRFEPGEFITTNPAISRADLARNCLNAGLWEIILYTPENGHNVPVYHGWFDFPDSLYGHLFEVHNGMDYAQYQKPLEHWVDPESKVVDLTRLRKVSEALEIEWTDASDAMYPLGGAREKKYKEIITPESFATMRDLQSDSTTFATFTPPGYYNRSDPRITELGRLVQVQDASVTTMTDASGNPGIEIQLAFSDGVRRTDLIIGGFDWESIPALSAEACNSGWKSSMGIGNHSFYESYQEHNQIHAVSNPYYALLLDEEGKWLDSHAVGIDGPVMHWDDEIPGRLHLWLLSFERHALVGHYIFDTPLKKPA